MNVNQRWRLRTYLYLLTLATLIPATFLVAWNAFSQSEQAEKSAASQAYNLAGITAQNTQIFLSDAQNLLNALATRIAARHRLAGGTCDPIFQEFKDLHPQFANLSQSSPEGYLVCSSFPQKEGKHTYVGDTEWFRKVYEKKSFIIAPPYKGVVTGRTVSVLAAPIRDENGQMVGALQLPIDLVNLRLMATTRNLPDSIIVSIFTTDGVQVARSDSPEEFVGRNLRGVEAVEMLLAKRDGTGKAVSSQGIERIFGFQPIPGTDWLAIAGIATSTVLQSSKATVLDNIVIGSLVLACIVVLATYLGRSISRPMANMQMTAARVAGGDYKQRAAIEGPSEVISVAQQFNGMLDSIERHIQEQSEREAKIYQLAFYDVLTGLPNRRMLNERLSMAIREFNARGDVGALFYIDLDHFKNINDTSGHAAGDQLLQTIASRLQSALPADYMLCRIGGDEFVVVTKALGTNHEEASYNALRMAADLKSAVNAPIDIVGYRWTASSSIGLTLFPKIGDTAERLLQEADIAVYRAKHQGRGQAVLFETRMHLELTNRLAMEADLKRAMEAENLMVHVQSQVGNSGNLRGVELLLRWNDPVRGMIPPGVFIPLAEQSELIVSLGNWVLREGCRIQARLGQEAIDIPVSVNVSPRQFRHPAFLEQVKESLIDTGADARRLIFEVTEGMLIENLEDTIDRMDELAGLGIRFSIDDFGTGYSSLAYLKSMPLHELKIDRSFIKDIPHDKNSVAIVQSILGMAKHLDLHVVAEGVETEEQAKFLTAHECQSMQGYLFGRPMPENDWFEMAMATEKIYSRL
jgi:diguanylate cyclase (GGDEF)-like protein